MQKFWILNQKIKEEINKNHNSADENELEKITNRFIENVENNIENFSYNKIVANLHEIYSSLNKIVKIKIDRNNWKKTTKNTYNNVPNNSTLANECLTSIEIKEPKDLIRWPEINKSILIEDNINFVVQINGKKRAILYINKGLGKEELLKKVQSDDKLKSYFKDKTIKNTIFIPNKLVNIII